MYFHVVDYVEVASTNLIVKHALESDEQEGYVCRAAIQTGGYGRQGRTWSSPAGGMYESLLLRPAVRPEQLPSIGLVCALAIRSALIGYATLPDDVVQVKWPNDLIAVGGKGGKIAGISSEAHAGGICIGIGVNVFHPSDGRDGEVVGKYQPAYLADFAELGSRFECEEVVCGIGDAILDEFGPRYEKWCVQGFAPFADEYRACSILTGEQVEIRLLSGDMLVEGRVEGIDDTGCLLVYDGSGIREISSGEAHITKTE